MTADDLSGLLLTEVRNRSPLYICFLESKNGQTFPYVGDQAEFSAYNGPSTILFLELQHFGKTTKKEKYRCKSSAVTIHFKTLTENFGILHFLPANSSTFSTCCGISKDTGRQSVPTEPEYIANNELNCSRASILRSPKRLPKLGASSTSTKLGSLQNVVIMCGLSENKSACRKPKGGRGLTAPHRCRDYGVLYGNSTKIQVLATQCSKFSSDTILGLPAGEEGVFFAWGLCTSEH